MIISIHHRYIDGKRNELDFVDEILKTDDYNRDGYLSYTEYTLARRREEAKMEARELPEELRG